MAYEQQQQRPNRLIQSISNATEVVKNTVETMKRHKFNAFLTISSGAMTVLATADRINSHLIVPQVFLGIAAISIGKMYHDYKNEHPSTEKPYQPKQSAFKKGVKTAFLTVGAAAGAVMCNKYQIPLNSLASVALGALAVHQTLKVKDAMKEPDLSKNTVTEKMKKMRQTSQEAPEFAPLRMF